MRKFTSLKFSSKFKKLVKQKSSGSQLSSLKPIPVQQQPSRTPTPNPTTSFANQPHTDPSANEAASLTPYNLPTSVAAPPSNSGWPVGAASQRNGTAAKDTAVNALKLLLKIESDIFRTGVKPALSGLLTIIEKVQDTSDKVHGFGNLARRIKDLEPIFLKVGEMKIEGASVDFLEKLEAEIKSLTTEMEQATSCGTLVRFFNSTNDMSSLESHNNNLDRIILEATLVSVREEIKLFQVHDTVFTTADEKKKILSWLSISGMVSTNNYDSALEKCLEDTACWIFGEDFFVKWKQSEGSVLRLIGKSGSGKTVLCASIIKSIAQSNNTACTYFFFDSRDDQRSLQSFDGILCSITYQLCVQLCVHLDALPAVLVTAYKNCGSGATLPSQDDVHQICSFALQHFPEAFIIIDALDECNELGQVSAWLKKLLTMGGGRLHVLITSRDKPHITAYLSGIQQQVIYFDDFTDADIELYIDSKIKESAQLMLWSKEIQTRIRESLLAGAGGMFRWVALQLSALNNCDDPDELTKQLENLPLDLNQSYEQIFANLSPHHYDIVLTIMQWLAFSKVPLSVDQICEAVAIVKVGEDKHPEFQPGKKWNQLSVEMVCADLVTVTDGKIKLAHFTVKEYLIAVQTMFSEGDANCLIAESCLGYLLQFTVDGSLNRSNIHNFKLVGYAAEYWVEHAKDAEKRDTKLEMMEKLIGHLFQPDGAAFVIWRQLWDPEYPQGEPDFARRPDSSLLYIASLLGLFYQVHRLIEKGADINAQEGEYGNALQAASYNGHLKIVKLLVEKGAYINTQGGRYGNGLYIASSRGHQEIVKLLIEKGADVNAQGGAYGNALYIVSSRGNQEIVKLLIKKGADVNAKGGYGTALYAASFRGQQEIVKLLIEKGANVNIQEGRYGNALQVASMNGHQEIVKLLIMKGADVNVQGGEYGNALQAAVFNGHQEIVKLLIEKVADVNAQGGEYGNALQAAISNGHEEIVKLLMEKGADVNAQDGEYGNVLCTAISNGHQDIVRLLIKNGADVNVQGGFYGNALQAASSRGHQEMVKLLIENGADVNAQGGFYGNVLQAASVNGHQEIMKLLMEKVANVNAQSGIWKLG